MKIGVGIGEEPEATVEPASNLVEVDEERYNEYMLSTAGPKKRRIFGAIGDDDQDEEDLASFERDAGVTQ